MDCHVTTVITDARPVRLVTLFYSPEMLTRAHVADVFELSGSTKPVAWI